MSTLINLAILIQINCVVYPALIYILHFLFKHIFHAFQFTTFQPKASSLWPVLVNISPIRNSRLTSLTPSRSSSIPPSPCVPSSGVFDLSSPGQTEQKTGHCALPSLSAPACRISLIADDPAVLRGLRDPATSRQSACGGGPRVTSLV